MDKPMEFMIYCIEDYKRIHNLTGRQVMELFVRHGVLPFLTECYGALHTTGPAYNVEEIDLFIAARQ